MALLKNKIFLAPFIAAIFLIAMVVTTPLVSATHYSLSISPESGEVTPPGSVKATVRVNFETLIRDSEANKIIFWIPYYDEPEWLDFKMDSPATLDSPGTMTITVSADAPPGKHTIKFRTCPKAQMTGPVCQHAPMYWGLYELTITEKEKKVRVQGFVGLTPDLPLGEVMVRLLLPDRELKTHADRDGKYSFEISVKEGGSVKARVVVSLTDERWIWVYDQFEFIYEPLVEYETEKFTIDASQGEITKDVLITDELESSAHEKKVNKDLAAVYYWAWKAASFAEDVLKLEPEPVEISAFAHLPPDIPGDYNPRHRRIRLDDSATREPVQVPSFFSYPAILLHEFSHHIETIAPFFGRPLEFDRTGYFGHGGYNNRDSKESVQEGFATFMAAVIGNYYHSQNANVITSNTPLNLEYNQKVWRTFDEETGDEDDAVASILWDLYDPVDPDDNDKLQLPLDLIWSVLNTIKRPATLEDILRRFAFGSEELGIKEQLHERFVASDVYVDFAGGTGSFWNGKYDVGETIGRSNWGYDDANGNNKRDSDEQFGTDPKYPRLWGDQRPFPPPIKNSVVILDIRDKVSKKPIESGIAKVEIKHPPPYDFYDWEYEVPIDTAFAEVPMGVLVPDYASAKVIVTAEGYKEEVVYEIDGKTYWQKIITPGLENLAEISVGLKSSTPAKPKTRVILIAATIALAILAALWFIRKFFPKSKV